MAITGYHAEIRFQSTLPVWAATAAFGVSRGNYLISIHAARVGSDNARHTWNQLQGRFQSTLPVWAATVIKHPFLEEKIISIHAARVGSDQPSASGFKRKNGFQSTLPVWAATAKYGNNEKLQPRYCGNVLITSKLHRLIRMYFCHIPHFLVRIHEVSMRAYGSHQPTSLN